jgi:hypothetical protein
VENKNGEQFQIVYQNVFAAVTVDGMDEWKNLPLAFLWDHMSTSHSYIVIYYQRKRLTR